MSSAPTILVADDDSHIREVIRFALEQAGYAVVEARNGREALEAVAAFRPALVVLDILMPELDGTEVCRELRRDSQLPIVFLSSRDEEVDRIVGLELGGDDYVTKPFSPRELVARVRAVLRRSQGQAAARGERLEVGRLRLDLDRHQAWWEQQAVTLTVTEFGLLRTLMGYPGKVYSRDELMDAVYGEQIAVHDRTIDSHVRRLRRKFAELGCDPVETVVGLGYRLGRCE